MSKIIIELITAGLGSVAFGLIFNVKKKYLPVTFGLGLLCWVAWLYFGSLIGDNLFITSLFTGLAMAIAAEIISRVLRAPSTIFFLTATIPIIPGGPLYHCMVSIVEGNQEMASSYGRATLFIALGISVGMSIAWAICDLSRKIRKRING
ncbi:MAG: threonine/serine exporter family protein [Lachnospiraceae bacterium]|nr:threonine/serine exporter family protein [Lachnospiraceae bacterium]